MAKKITTRKTAKSSTGSTKARTTRSQAKSSTSAGKKVTKKKTTKKKTVKKTASKNPVTKKTTTKKTSTKKNTTKKIIVKKTAPAPVAVKPERKKKIKTHLSKKELNHYQALLNIKRHELIGDINSMSKEALRSNSSNLSAMPIHMADVGSDAYEQEHTLGLVESEQKMLTEIEEALQRIKDKTYAVCLETGKKITKARLDAKPWAKYCIEVVRELERTGKI